MRVLVLAYACEPDRGSEAEVGWRWVRAMGSAGHQVTVVTRTNNRDKIQAALRDTPCASTRFVYHEAPRVFLLAKRWFTLPRLYYVAWQVSLIPRLIKWVSQKSYDRYHQLTYVSARFPSVLALAGSRFVWGPIGGLGVVPRALRSTLPLKARVSEFMRDAAARLDRINPLWWWSVLACRRMLIADTDTYERMPKLVHSKSRVASAIGIDFIPEPRRALNPTISEVLIIGQLVPQKGHSLALCALAEIVDVSWRCEVIGEGPDRTRLERLSRDLELSDRVCFRGALPRTELLQRLAERPIVVALSYRESGGMAILEAASNGCPLVYLKLGGPALILGDVVSGAVPVDSPQGVVAESSRWLRTYICDQSVADRAGREAWIAAMHHTWDTKSDAVGWLYGLPSTDERESSS
ncbi:MAG: glycosyltransferase [Anaerosomatales bacterium]|nr:glycosyltransferase [Anaerosomatales bacterium]